MKKLIVFSALVLGVFTVFISLSNCKKSGNEGGSKNHSLTIEQYIAKAKIQEQIRRARNLSTARYSGDFYIDYSTTQSDELNVDDTTYNRFGTYVSSRSDYQDTIGLLIGYVLGDGTSVFNVLALGDPVNTDNEQTVHVSTLDGEQLGTYIANSVDGWVKGDIQETGPGIDIYTPIRRSWFSCIWDCIDDAQFACVQNARCNTLLLISNLGGKGMGSVSIAAGCMAACTKNHNLDLLPNH